MSFPFSIVDVEKNINEKLKNDFEGVKSGFVQVGPLKYVMPGIYRQVANDIYNFKLRFEDVWVCTYPRSGTTVMQELMWQVANDFDYMTAAKKSLFSRFPFIDFSFLLHDELKQDVMDKIQNEKEKEVVAKALYTPLLKVLEETPSPRFIKSHLPFSLLPPKLLDTSKVVYVARNPKDMVVSYYHHNRLLRGIGYVGDFPQYYDYFEQDLVHPGSFWEHIKEAWQLRDNPNLLFLFYEDLVKDMKGSIRKVASFLGKQVTEQQVERLADHLHVDNFRKNPATNGDMDYLPGTKVEGEQSFVRIGKNGSWKADFTPELTRRADQWVAENISKIPGFAFPPPS